MTLVLEKRSFDPAIRPDRALEEFGILMPASTPWNRRAHMIADGVALALMVVVAGIALLTFRDYGLGWDDYTHAEYGQLLSDLYASGFADRRALSFVNLYAYGGGFDLVAALAAKFLPLTLFETRRLVGAVVGLLGLCVTWRLGRRLGGPYAGACTVLLLATCPLYYGHMFMNAKDAPFAVAMAILILSLIRLFDEYPRPSTASGALFAVGVGLAIGSRILGGFGAIYAAAALLFLVIIEARQIGWGQGWRRAGAFVVALLPWLVPAYAVMALVWPWSVVDPVNPIKALLYFSHFFETPWRELFDSTFILVPDMPRRYLAQLLVLQLPEIMLGLGVAGCVGGVVALGKAQVAPQRRAALLVVLLAVTFPVVLTVALRPAMYNGIRHFLFLVPPIATLGGLAGGWLLSSLGRWKPPAAMATAALIMLGCIPTVAAMARLHPYEYVHFNAIAGGTSGARGHYMLDYWGLSFKQATDALRAKLAENPAYAGRRWHVATCGPHPPAKLGLARGFQVDWEPRRADFALMLGEYYCRELDAPVFVEIIRDGVVFARVYDIRGLQVDNLLYIPKP
jgi:hypothetical protein